jgi:hypothetical protein
MVDVSQEFEVLLTTENEVQIEHPTWSSVAVRDYVARGRNTVLVAEQLSGAEDSQAGVDPLAFALINDIRRQIGSGNPLTSDETGFTVDTTNLSVDMAEA